MSIHGLNLFQKTRINISEILHDYFKSLRNSQGKINKLDRRTFFYFPVFSGILMSLLGNVSKDYIMLIVTSMAIISGLLLNMLLLLTSEANNAPKDHVDLDTRKQLIKETVIVISYTILISIGLISFLTICYFITPSKWDLIIDNYRWIIGDLKYVFSVITVSITIHILINVLLIVRRIHKFFQFEIR